MAADLDRAGRGSGGPAGRAGVIQAGRSPAGPGKYSCSAGEDFIVFRYIIYVFQ